MLTALVQARMSSTRLPGKVLMQLAGKPVLERIIERLKQAQSISRIIVLTSEHATDNQIVDFCAEAKVEFFRGDLTDVLLRYQSCVKEHKLKHIVRITGDCPLIEATLIDKLAKNYFEGEYDYAATNRPVGEETFPDGLDCEIFSAETLDKAFNQAVSNAEREHVTPYIWQNTQLFKCFFLKNHENLSCYHLTLDEPADLTLISKIFENLKDPTLSEVLAYIESRPELRKLSLKGQQNKAYLQNII